MKFTESAHFILCISRFSYFQERNTLETKPVTLVKYRNNQKFSDR